LKQGVTVGQLDPDVLVRKLKQNQFLLNFYEQAEAFRSLP